MRSAAIALLFLAGCVTAPVVPPPVVVVPPVGPATSAQIVALEGQIAQQADLAQRASGAVYGADDANSQNVPGLPTDAVKAQLEEAASALPPPTDAQKLEKANQNSRILSGQLIQVKAEMGQKITENEKLKAALLDHAKQLAEISSKAALERADAAAKLQKQFDEMTKLITNANSATKKAQDAARDAIAKEQVMWLNRIGAACAAIAIVGTGLAAVFGGLTALRAVAPFSAIFIIGALSCFGFAQIVGQPWFKWTVLGSSIIITGIASWWVWAKYKTDTLKQEAEANAAQLKGVLTKVVPVLDRAYSDASQAGKELMDSSIFTPLNSEMENKDKATVLQIKAEAVNTPKP
jgi:hypothetical protein